MTHLVPRCGGRRAQGVVHGVWLPRAAAAHQGSGTQGMRSHSTPGACTRRHLQWPRDQKAFRRSAVLPLGMRYVVDFETEVVLLNSVSCKRPHGTPRILPAPGLARLTTRSSGCSAVEGTLGVLGTTRPTTRGLDSEAATARKICVNCSRLPRIYFYQSREGVPGSPLVIPTLQAGCFYLYRGQEPTTWMCM